MWVRATSVKFQSGKRSEAVALCKEMLALCNWPGSTHVYTADTGVRAILVWTVETEEPGALHNRMRYINPHKSEAFSGLWTKWHELIVPGSHREKFWQEW